MTRSPRPVLLGLVGDSGAGKTTMARSLTAILGESCVTHIRTDDYHRFDRAQRAERGLTPLDPDCNYLDILAHDLRDVRDGQPILKPVYRHRDGTFGAPEYVAPKQFVIVEGLLGYHSEELSGTHDVRVFLAPAEELRREWKVKRDVAVRGYTTQQVLAELEARRPDADAFIRRQRRRAHIVVSFGPGRDPERFAAQITLYGPRPQPDVLSVMLAVRQRRGITLDKRAKAPVLSIPGDLDCEFVAAIKQALWEQMPLAHAVCSDRIGELAVDGQSRRYPSLAVVQMLIIYALDNARAAAVRAELASAEADRPAHDAAGGLSR